MKNQVDELYFCLRLTENEHYVVEDEIRQKCEICNCQTIYYRMLKDGHVPLFREIKIQGHKFNLNHVKAFIYHFYKDNITKNPHKHDCRDF